MFLNRLLAVPGTGDSVNPHLVTVAIDVYLRNMERLLLANDLNPSDDCCAFITIDILANLHISVDQTPNGIEISNTLKYNNSYSIYNGAASILARIVYEQLVVVWPFITYVELSLVSANGPAATFEIVIME